MGILCAAGFGCAGGALGAFVYGGLPLKGAINGIRQAIGGSAVAGGLGSAAGAGLAAGYGGLHGVCANLTCGEITERLLF